MSGALTVLALAAVVAVLALRHDHQRLVAAR
jgi:hypothetical protein